VPRPIKVSEAEGADAPSEAEVADVGHPELSAATSLVEVLPAAAGELGFENWETNVVGYAECPLSVAEAWPAVERVEAVKKSIGTKELAEGATAALFITAVESSQSAQADDAGSAAVVTSAATSVGPADRKGLEAAGVDRIEIVSDTTVAVEVFHSTKAALTPSGSPPSDEGKTGTGSHLQYNTGGCPGLDATQESSASVDAAKPKIARDRNIIIELAVLFSSANPLAPFRYVCTLIEGFSGCVKLLKAQTNERPNKRTNE